MKELPRIPFAQLPTPIEHLPRLSSALGGPQIFVKRDDQTGLWREGAIALRNEMEDVYLPWACRATTDWWTGEELTEAKHVTRDDKYVVRAWMAVLTYLLADYRFVYE